MRKAFVLIAAAAALVVAAGGAIDEAGRPPNAAGQRLADASRPSN